MFKEGMMKVHFIIHEAFEGPGAFLSWAKSHDYQVTYSRVYLDESLPQSADAIDMLVVLGGPQNPNTRKVDCEYFDALAETRFILACIEADKAVVGVCLGAQLIGEALGAPFEISPEKEIGNYPILMTERGKTNTKFFHFGDTQIVGHWHNDMPGLTKSSQVLATSQGCPRQIVEYTNLVYGFQCHLEFTLEDIENLIEHSIDELASLTEAKYVQQPQELRSNTYQSMNTLLDGFLNNLVASYRKTIK